MGVYPEVSLKEARDKHMLLRKMVSEGKDPGLEQKKQKAMAIVDNNNTFEAVARDWHEYKKDQSIFWTQYMGAGHPELICSRIFFY